MIKKFFFEKGIGSLLDVLKKTKEKIIPPKEPQVTNLDDVNVFSSDVAVSKKELVPTDSQVEERLSYEELQTLKKLKRDSAEIQLGYARKPLSKIIPNDPDYAMDSADHFTNLGKVQDFKKGQTSIVPRASALAQNISAHPSNEPLSPDEWVKWIKRRMNKSVNDSLDERLDTVDLSIKQQEIDDSNLFKTQGQLNQEIIQDLTVMDDPQIIYALDKLRQRFGTKEMDKYLEKLKKSLQTEISSAKKDKLVGGYLKSAQDKNIKLTKRDLIKLVENNPLYHARATHLRYNDKQEDALENGIDAIENGYLQLQKIVDDETIRINKYIQEDKRFKRVTGQDAQGRDVSGFTDPDAARLLEGLESYRNNLMRVSRHISLTDGLHKNFGLREANQTADALNYNRLQDQAGQSGYTPIDYLNYARIVKTTGGKLSDQSRDSIERAVKATIEIVKTRGDYVFDIAYNKGSEIPKSVTTFPKELKKAHKKIRTAEDNFFKNYLQAQDDNLSPVYRSYSSYAIGGEDKYGEIILNLPHHKKNFFNALEVSSKHYSPDHIKRTNTRTVSEAIAQSTDRLSGKFPSVENVSRLQINPLYFSRYTVQKMDNGDGILMINELQADFGQALRELKRRGEERINPFNSEFFTKDSPESLNMRSMKISEITRRLEEIDNARLEQGLLTDTQSKEYKELLLDALVEEKIMKKSFSGSGEDVISAYNNSSQARDFPYLPLSSMQGISDHAIKTYSKIAANDIKGVTHIGVYPVEYLHGRKRGMNKAPNWIQYGSKEGKAGYVKANGNKVGLPKKKATIHKAMEKFAKQYGVKLEKKLVARSNPDKPFKLVFVQGAQQSSSFRTDAQNVSEFTDAIAYMEHFGAFKTKEQAIRVYRTFKKFFDRDMGDLTIVKMDKLVDGRPNPDLYDEFITLPIPNNMLDLPTTGYYKGGLVRSGFKW